MLPRMRPLNLARTAGLALGVGLAASACSSTPEPAQAFVKLVVGPSISVPGACAGYPSDTTLMQVGMPGGEPNDPAVQPTRISTGAQTIQISCSVHPTGSTFSVALQIAQGNVSINGSTSMTITALNVDPTTGAMNVKGDVSNSIAGDYSSSACALTFGALGAGATPPVPSIEPGRIWAHLSCPAAQNPSIQQGNGVPSTCDTEVDFIFENCGT
jgi:hypothetical protein